MKRSHITEAYKNADSQAFSETNDPHQIILTMLDALIKSMNIFVLNINLKEGGDSELKSKHFARALTIIYSLQSSLDFEKGGDIANNLFQVYEYARQKLISDLAKGEATDTPSAINALGEIFEAWKSLKTKV